MINYDKTDALQDPDLLWFGKHKNHRLEDVPASYLLWLWNDGLCHELQAKTERGRLARYVANSMTALRQECPDTIVEGV